RPAEAIILDAQGVAARRIFGWHRLPWHRIEQVRQDRRSLVLASTPITWWKLMFRDQRLIRLDATLTDASLNTLTDEVTRWRSHALHLPPK
ncbi:MAG: hypothetical protein AAGJ70_11680, partial [Pseudomonadota bacterium]